MSDQTIATLVMWLLTALLFGAVCLRLWTRWMVRRARRDAEREERVAREARRAAGTGALPVRHKVIIGAGALLVWLGGWALGAWLSYQMMLQNPPPVRSQGVLWFLGVLCLLGAPWFVRRVIQGVEADRETPEQRRQFERW